MTTSISIISALGAALILAGCASSAPQQAPRACACSSYVSAAPRPAWVDAGDIQNAALVASQGSAQCTGVRQIDFDAADLSARSKLARIIETRTEVTLSETRSDAGYGAGSSQARIDASAVSKVVLEGSTIAARWVDPDSCLLHAQASITRTTLEATKARLAAEEAARLINQPFMIIASGAYAAAIEAQVKQALSKAGMTKIVSTADSRSHRAVTDLQIIARDKKSLNGQLTLALQSPAGDTLWSRTVAARGVSYSEKSEAELVARALSSAMRQMAAPLKSVINQ